MSKTKKLISSIIISMGLSSCFFRVNDTAAYYKNNKVLTMALYNNYIKLNQQLPYPGLTIRQLAGEDGKIRLTYKIEESHTQDAYYTSTGEYIKGSSDSLSVTIIQSEAFKTFVSDFIKSEYISINGMGDNKVFFAYGSARHNNREHIGILITEDPNPMFAVKKIEDKVYVYEADVP